MLGNLNVFLAAPLFNESERDFNKRLASRLRLSGFNVWMAQEAPFITHGSPREKKRIFESDLEALRKSDAVVAILDGKDVDSGSAFEIGYAYALSKLIIGLKTDYRMFSRMEEVNLMLEVPLVRLCRSIEEVIDVLELMQKKRSS
jgi:nucleoside 2-deoxyribosyltransferase